MKRNLLVSLKETSLNVSFTYGLMEIGWEGEIKQKMVFLGKKNVLQLQKL